MGLKGASHIHADGTPGLKEGRGSWRHVGHFTIAPTHTLLAACALLHATTTGPTGEYECRLTLSNIREPLRIHPTPCDSDPPVGDAISSPISACSMFDYALGTKRRGMCNGVEDRKTCWIKVSYTAPSSLGMDAVPIVGYLKVADTTDAVGSNGDPCGPPQYYDGGVVPKIYVGMCSNEQCGGEGEVTLVGSGLGSTSRSCTPVSCYLFLVFC